MKKETVTIVGVGDILIDRAQPETIFQHVADVMRSADITFANAEQMYSDKGYPTRMMLGSYSDPRNIPALLYAGIDVLSLANNHTLDWGSDALLDTMARLKEVGLPYVGVGKNLAESHQPVILERNGTRVGFLAYSCTGPEGFEAWEDKPGYAPVRIWTIYEKVDYQPATLPKIVSFAYKEDLAAMVEDIQKLKAQVDVVVISFHWGQHFMSRVIPMYCFEVGHAAIDAGADLILGGHTHILKGIEVYKGKVIFFSLSNFAIELGPNAKSRKHYYNVHDQLFKQYNYNPAEAKKTLMAKAIVENGEIKRVSYLPGYINEHDEPEIVTQSTPKGQEVFNYVEDISRSEKLPVHFSWDGDEVLILP